jgi:amino acid transporter
MAEDGYMPPLFTPKHPRFGTPWIAILVSSGCYAMLTLKSLTQLITV